MPSMRSTSSAFARSPRSAPTAPRAHRRPRRTLDTLLWRVVEETGAADDDETLLIALADHGGGGIRVNDHEGDHPANWTIPLLLLGGAVQAGELPDPVALLDVAPTAAWALGLMPPTSWTGRALHYLMAPAHAA